MEDIRWYNKAEDRKCTYIETLTAQVNLRNTLIQKQKWDKIEKLLPTITEEEAKQLCFDIRNESRAEIRYYQTLYG